MTGSAAVDRRAAAAGVLRDMRVTALPDFNSAAKK
jgi:hypothetical protein